MADDEKTTNESILNDQSKDFINIMMLNRIVVRLIAEVATINRSPSEAEKLVKKWKSEISAASAAVLLLDSEVSEAWHAEQKRVLNAIFDHITFETNK